MDLQYSTETRHVRQYDWLANDFYLKTAMTLTVVVPTAGDNETDLYPDGFLLSGLVLAQYASGGNSGLWAPYVSDDATATSLDEPGAILLDGGEIRKSLDGSLISTVVVVSALMAGTPQQVITGKMPATLDADNTTNHTIVAADLPAGFVDLVLS